MQKTEVHVVIEMNYTVMITIIIIFMMILIGMRYFGKILQHSITFLTMTTNCSVSSEVVVQILVPLSRVFVASLLANTH